MCPGPFLSDYVWDKGDDRDGVNNVKKQKGLIFFLRLLPIDK